MRYCVISFVFLVISPAVFCQDPINDDEFDNILFDRVVNALEGKVPINKKKGGKSFDCEGLAHYIKTGSIGCLVDPPAPNIYQVDVNLARHVAFSGYKMWYRRLDGSWGMQHYFVYLGNNEYLSKNGAGMVSIFNSFKEMVMKDGFPGRLVDINGLTTNNIAEVVIGESVAFTRVDYTK